MRASAVCPALLLALVLVPLLPGAAAPAAAQCCGDCAGDGTVTIDDLIRAVLNALDGCAATTPTETPLPAATATVTRTPTRTRTPNDRCPRTFTDANNQCTFNGRYNNGCGSAVNASFAVSGTTVVVSVTTGIANPAVVRFAATRDTASRANLTGWSVNNFQTTNPVAGQVRLEDDGARLVIFPNDPPFQIQSCNFVQYDGQYVRPRSAAAALDAAAALAHLTAARPIPELAEP